MQRQKHDRIQVKYGKLCALLGAFLTLIPTCFTNLWGNISIYVISYYYHEHGIVSGMTSPWVPSTYIIGIQAGLAINGRLSRILSTPVCLLLGFLFFNGSLFTCYFALKYAIAPLFYTAVLLLGISTGVLDCSVFITITQWANSDSGTLISIACAGINFGPSLLNSVVSAHVNPNNLSPDSTLEKLEIFTQSKVIGKVASMFLVLGSVTSVVQLVGILMLIQKRPKWQNFLIWKRGKGYGSFPSPQEESSTPAKAIDNREIVEEQVIVSSHFDYMKTSISSDAGDENKIESVSLLLSGGHCVVKKQYSPSQLMKYYVFYLLWICYGSQVFTTLLLSNYYKSFGLLSIHNDRFLTSLGSVTGIAGGVTILAWGFALDRLSIKTSLVFMYSSLVGFILLMYFSPEWDQWFYFVSTVVLGCISSCVYPTFVTATMVFFGDEHFNSNLGLISTAYLMTSLLAPPIFVFLLVHYGWFSLFGCTASINAVDLIMIVLVCPQSRK